MIVSLKMALRSISANKLRAMLTMLGIIIGVMALVVLVSLVGGATGSVTDAVSGLGSSLLTVTIKEDKGYPIDLQTLEKWMGEEKAFGLVAPTVTDTVTGSAKGESGSVTVYGTTPAYYEIHGLQLTMGRFIKRTDVENHSYVCVINETAAEELLGYADCVGEAITLNSVQYTVVGVLAEGDSLTSVFSSGNLVAYLPYTSLVRLSSGVSGEVTEFCISAPQDGAVQNVETAITDILMDRFDDDEDAFEITTQDALEDAMSSITSALTVLLGGIAAVSLVVGGIGIMNIMLVTVTERTREIGIRKAIGAGRGSILLQFLLEAVVLCMLGCGLGIFFSWSILQILSTVVASLDITFRLDGTVVLIAVAFCFIIGVVFGLYPANKAAKMKPIDALHYGG